MNAGLGSLTFSLSMSSGLARRRADGARKQPPAAAARPHSDSEFCNAMAAAAA